SSRPIVIGRRGAMGPMPESTLEGYARAIADGADYVECNVICTADLELICWNDLDLTLVTNVAHHPELSQLKSTAVIEGQEVEGFFAFNFTFEQIQILRVEQRYQWRDKTLHGRLSIPTLSHVLALVLSSNQNPELLAARGNRPVGLMLEPRYPEFHESIGCPLLESLLTLLSVNNLQPPPRPSNPFNTLTSSSSPTASLSDRLASISTTTISTDNAPTAGAATAGGRIVLDPAVQPVVIEARSSAALVYCSQRTSIPLVQILEAGWDEPSDTNPILQAPPPACPPTVSLAACMLDVISLHAMGIAPEKHLVLPVEAWHKKRLPTPFPRPSHPRVLPPPLPHQPSDTNPILQASSLHARPPPPCEPACWTPFHSMPWPSHRRSIWCCQWSRGTRSCSTKPCPPSDTNPILQAPPPSCPPTTPLRACMLDAISLYAVAIAPEKHLVLPVESWHKKLLNQTDLVSLARHPARQLAVLPWPFANDWIFLSLSYELVSAPRFISSLHLSLSSGPSKRDPLNEYAMFVEAVGVDGLFSDFPATALKYIRSRDCLAAASGVLGALVATPRKRGLAGHEDARKLVEEILCIFTLARSKASVTRVLSKVVTLLPFHFRRYALSVVYSVARSLPYQSTLGLSLPPFLPSPPLAPHLLLAVIVTIAVLPMAVWALYAMHKWRQTEQHQPWQDLALPSQCLPSPLSPPPLPPDLLILTVIITIAVLRMAVWTFYIMHKWRQTVKHLHWQEFATIHSHGSTTASETQTLTALHAVALDSDRPSLTLSVNHFPLCKNPCPSIPQIS
ncbi:unnamed protein product, partial [Closterium sp. NIES-65]